MLPVSVVVITKNEERNIERCMKPWIGVCDQLLLVDNGSTDNTLAIAAKFGIEVFQTTWKGYGNTKNEGNRMARHPWILSLDADEVANPDLVAAVQEVFSKNPDPRQVYAIRRKLVIDQKHMHFGSSKKEFRIRLFHRDQVCWNESPVHEDLLLPKQVHVYRLNGYVYHYSFATFSDQARKLEHYAQLSAQGMFQRKRKVTFLKKYLSAFTVFLKNYVLRLGFLDGNAGWMQVSQEMQYAFKKYLYLENRYKA